MEEKAKKYHEVVVKDTIVEALLIIEGLADIENKKTIDGNVVKARAIQKYGFES